MRIISTDMDHMKSCSYVSEHNKATRIDKVEMADQSAPDKTKSSRNLVSSYGSESSQIKATTNLETSRESWNQVKIELEPNPFPRMIRRSPQVSSFRDFAPSKNFTTRRHSGGAVAVPFPFVPQPNSRIMEKLTPHRIQRWSHSFLDLLSDHVGIQMFLAFLEKEFSAENLRFWLACQELKQTPRDNVPKLVSKIFSDFFHEDSTATINVDSKTLNHVRINLNNPSYNTFDLAQEHIFQLMKTDSYPRFLRSERYKQLLKDSSGKSRKK